MRAQCFTREVLTICEEIEDERVAAEARTGNPVSADAVRITFFRTCPQSGRWQDCHESQMLGYAVILQLQLHGGDTRTCLLEACTRVPLVWIPDGNGVEQSHNVSNYYIHCHRELKTVVGTGDEHLAFTFDGTFFCQQNDLTHVCAHAALRAAVNSSPVGNGAKLTNKQINDLLQIDHATNCVGKYGAQTSSIGLQTFHIKQVVEQLGWSPIIVDFTSNPAIDYEDFVYPIVESACPLILGIHNLKTAHVMTVLGHSLNSDRWTPEARRGYGAFPISPYISTSAWADHFVVSDDNFGPHVTLPTESIRNIFVPKHNPNLHAALAIGLMPTGVTTSGYEAEQLASSMVSRLLNGVRPMNRWLGVLQTHALVCRTLLRQREQYLDVLSDAVDSEGSQVTEREVEALKASFPDSVWVTELTVPNLYTGNKHKLGDVIVKANATRQEIGDWTAVEFIWIPGICSHTPAATGAIQPWSLTGHIPLLRGSEPASLVEW